MCVCLVQVLCAGALVNSSVSLDKPAPKAPFEADFCGEWVLCGNVKVM